MSDDRKAVFRKRMGEAAPEMLAGLDMLKALYGDDMTVQYVVTTAEVFGKVEPAEVERIRERLQAERDAPKEPAPTPAPVTRYRGRK